MDRLSIHASAAAAAVEVCDVPPRALLQRRVQLPDRLRCRLSRLPWRPPQRSYPARSFHVQESIDIVHRQRKFAKRLASEKLHAQLLLRASRWPARRQPIRQLDLTRRIVADLALQP